jgi:hypothetical protein
VSGRLAVEELAPADYPRWERHVQQSPQGSAYSLPSYLEALCAAAGGRLRVLAALKGDEIVGGVALYERSSPLGPFVAPRLLLYYNGFVLRAYGTRYPSEQAARHLETVDALADRLEKLGYGRLELRTRSSFSDARALVARGWTATPSYSYVIPLTDLEAQWGRVEQNLRRLVERSATQGITVSADGDFADFYRLHRETHERKGAPLYLEADAFRAFYEALRAREICRLYHARLPSGQTVAAQLVLLGHPVTHTASAATDADHLSSGVTALLRWRVCEDLAQNGYAANDLTDATLNSVTRFKSQLGGTLELGLVTSRPQSAAFRVQHHTYRGLRRLRGALAGLPRPR